MAASFSGLKGTVRAILGAGGGGVVGLSQPARKSAKAAQDPELKAWAYQEFKEWNPDSCIVEAKAAGSPLIFELRAIAMIDFSKFKLFATFWLISKLRYASFQFTSFNCISIKTNLANFLTSES